MNRILQVPSFLLVMLFTGCDTEHLNLVEHAKIIAPILRVDEAEVKFLSYCSYRSMKEVLSEQIIASEGIVAMTENYFYIMSRYQDRVKIQGIVGIPIGELESLATSSSQFHLKHKGLTMLVWLNEAPNDALTEEKYATVTRLFAQNGVSIFEADQTYEIAKLADTKRYKRFNSGFYNSGFSNDFESSSNGSPYPVGGRYDSGYHDH